MRLLFILLCFILAVNGCQDPPYQVSYKLENHFNKMNVSLLYEKTHAKLADEIHCSLNGTFKTVDKIPFEHLDMDSLCTNNIVSGNGTLFRTPNLHFCYSASTKLFLSKTQFIGKIHILISIGGMGKTDMEYSCNVSANVLYLKFDKNQQIFAHFTTPRTDLIVPVRKNESLSMLPFLLDILLVSTGPLKPSPDLAIYKTLIEPGSKLEVAFSIVPYIAGVAVVVVAAVATFIFVTRTVQIQKQKKEDLVAKSNLLADWAENEETDGELSNAGLWDIPTERDKHSDGEENKHLEN